MWIAALAAGWIAGCVSLYAFLVATAKEPANGECFECRRMECRDCQHTGEAQQELRKAA